MDFDVLPVLADPFQTEADFERFDHELDAVRDQWADTIMLPDFTALQFTVTIADSVAGGGILTQSIRAENFYQLTRLNANGIPLSHHDYQKSNLSALLDDLPYSTEHGTVHVKVMQHSRKIVKKERCKLSLEGDTADKMVHEGLEITETAIKLAGLGAKNLAALLLALLRDNVKLKGKTSMNRLLRDGKQLATFTIKKEDLAAFRAKAGKRFLFTAVGHIGNDKKMCDILAPAEHTGDVNRILEVLGYDKPLEVAEKNGKARAPQDDKSSGRGFGWLQQAMEMRNDPVKQFENKTDRLESLGAETLAALVLKIAGENREFHEASPLSNLFAEGQDIQMVNLPAGVTPAIQKQAAALAVPVHFQEGNEGRMTMVARSADAPIINRICENMDLRPPLKVGPQETPPPQPQKRGPGRPRKDAAAHPPKESVKGKVKDAAQQAKGGKSAPAKAAAPKAKAPKPKAPVR